MQFKEIKLRAPPQEGGAIGLYCCWESVDPRMHLSVSGECGGGTGELPKSLSEGETLPRALVRGTREEPPLPRALNSGRGNLVPPKSEFSVHRRNSNLGMSPLVFVICFHIQKYRFEKMQLECN